jgi:dTDP-glucose 4,6-dehydratase
MTYSSPRRGFLRSNFIYHQLQAYPEDACMLDKLPTGQPQDARLRGIEEPPFVAAHRRRACVGALTRRRSRHVATRAESHVDRYEDPGVPATNVLGVQVLHGKACLTCVKRFHQVSTDEVTATALDRPDLLFTEKTPLHAPALFRSRRRQPLRAGYHRTYACRHDTRCSKNYGPTLPEKLIR